MSHKLLCVALHPRNSDRALQRFPKTLYYAVVCTQYSLLIGRVGMVLKGYGKSGRWYGPDFCGVWCALWFLLWFWYGPISWGVYGFWLGELLVAAIVFCPACLARVHRVGLGWHLRRDVFWASLRAVVGAAVLLSTLHQYRYNLCSDHTTVVCISLRTSVTTQFASDGLGVTLCFANGHVFLCDTAKGLVIVLVCFEVGVCICTGIV